MSIGDLGVGDDSSLLTFDVGSVRLAVPIAHVERVSEVSHLTPVPFAERHHLGLVSDGDELVPVLALDGRNALGPERLVAIVKVRGQAVALPIDRTGRVHATVRPVKSSLEPPELCRGLAPQFVSTDDGEAWRIDVDRLRFDSKYESPLSKTSQDLTPA